MSTRRRRRKRPLYLPNWIHHFPIKHSEPQLNSICSPCQYLGGTSSTCSVVNLLTKKCLARGIPLLCPCNSNRFASFPVAALWFCCLMWFCRYLALIRHSNPQSEGNVSVVVVWLEGCFPLFRRCKLEDRGLWTGVIIILRVFGI